MMKVSPPQPFSVTTVAAHLVATWPNTAVTDPADGTGLLWIHGLPNDQAEQLQAALAAYVFDPQAEALAVAMAEATAERGRRLAASVTWAMPDTPAGPERDAWLAYRAELHALPEQEGWPLAVAWPVHPA